MLIYLLRRLLELLLVLFGVSVLVFSMIRLIPGDAVLILLGANTEITPERGFSRCATSWAWTCRRRCSTGGGWGECSGATWEGRCGLNGRWRRRSERGCPPL